MNTGAVLAGEFVIAVGINSWGAIKQGFVPWSGTVTRCGIAFGIIGVTAQFVPQLAVWLGGGFLLASIIAIAQGGWGIFGAVPPVGDYSYLQFGQAAPDAGDDN